MSNAHFVEIDVHVNISGTHRKISPSFHIDVSHNVRQTLDSRLPVNNTGGAEQGHFICLSRKCCLLVSHCLLTLFLTFGCWLFWTDLFYCQSSVTCDLGWRRSSPQSLPLLIPPIVKIHTTLLQKLLPLFLRFASPQSHFLILPLR